MPRYSEVITAIKHTMSAMSDGRTPSGYHLEITTNGGHTAGIMVDTYGNRVCLDMPSMDSATLLSRDEGDYMTGLVAHEYCHVAHTNFGIWTSSPVQNDARLRNLLNCLEDARIEAKEIARGKTKGLAGLLEHVQATATRKAILARKASGQPALGSVEADFDILIANTARIANGYTLPGIPEGVARIPAFARPAFEHGLKGIPKLKNTAEALELSREVLAMLNAARPAPVAQPEPTPAKQPAQDKAQDTDGDTAPADDASEAIDKAQDNEAKGKASDADTDGDGEDARPEPAQTDAPYLDGDKDDTDAGEPAASAPADEAKADAATDSKPGAGAGSDFAAPSADLAQLSDKAGLDALTDAISERTEDTMTHRDQSDLMMFDGATLRKIHPGRKDTEAKAQELRRIIPTPGVLRDQISRMIKSDEKHGTERYRATGRLDRRALTRATMDAPNVFQRRTFAPGVDTAVMFLIDGSNSMGQSIRYVPEGGDPKDYYNYKSCTYMDLALMLALHMAEAAERARGKCAVVGFKGRRMNVTLHTMKDFSDRVDDTRIAAFSHGEATPLAAAILGAADLLAAQPAKRRILMVLSDGGDDNGAMGVKAAVKMAEYRGLECVGIGCGTNVAYAFDRHVNCYNPATVPTEGLGALVALLERA